MLLFLTNSLIVADNDSAYDSIKKAVRNLATASCEGKHYLLGEEKVIEYFCKIFKPANDDVSRLFDNLRQNYAIQKVPNTLTIYWEVVKDNPTTRMDDGTEIVQLEYKEFLDTRAIQETVLVGEDIEYDCWFYRFILKWYLNKLSVHVYCMFKDRHGGGGRMAEVLQQCYCDKESSLCFVDTDKKYPTQPIASHSTCKKCLHIQQGPRNKVEELNVQEIENLLPLNYLDMLNYEGDNKTRKDQFDALRDKSDSEQVLQFFDLKCGVKKYLDYKDSQDFKDFAKTICLMNPDIMGGKSFNEYYSSINDEEIIYPGLMKRILKQTIDIVKNGVTEAPALMGYQEIEWEIIGRLMLSYGFARRPEGITN